MAVHIYRCMPTGISFKFEIVKDSNKFYKNVFRNILNSSTPKISKWPDTLSKSCCEWSWIWL